MKIKYQRLLKILVVALVVVGISFQLFAPLKAYAKDRYLNLQLFAKVLNLVQRYYVDEVDTKKLIYGGIKGILSELDPHTNFLPPTIYKEFITETSGKFGGLGIEITVQDDVLTIISPIEDAPAWKAGLESGDKIVSINGKSTKGLSLAESAQLMRGDMGSKIVLGIIREGFKAIKNFAVVRGSVKVKSVKYTDLKEGFGYVRLTSFIENSASEMQKALKKMEKNAKGQNSKIKGLVLDMRRNPGGLLDQAVKISDFFLDKGKIVSTTGREKSQRKVVSATKKGSRTDFPIVVLINEYSASASEIVAGALKDNKRALIMGKRSFGKGSVQSVVPMGDGSGLKLTVARYYTPSGVSIQAKGITPDVVVEDVDPEAFQKAIIRRQVRRESDISGHLMQEDTKAKREPSSAKSAEKPAFGWWTKTKTKSKTKKKKLDKDGLLQDYQVLQAYNYLKAYRVMKDL